MIVTQAKWIRFRLWMILFVFVLVWGGVLWRAFHLQVLDRDQYASIAEKEAHKIVELKPVRGEIFDRNGEKLAVSLVAHSVFAEPNKLENPDEAALKLSKALGISKKALARNLKNRSTFSWVKRQVTPEELARIVNLKIEGVESLKESKRFYPNNFLAAHVLGFVGIDNRGLEGLEMGCDEYLKGGVNRVRVRRDALGRTLVDTETGAPMKNKGSSLVLTLDRRIQYVTETALNRAVQKFGAKGGLAMVVKPQTGEILASAVCPSFNPNVFGNYSPSQRRNRALTDTFDPGSTFKVFLVAGALEAGVVKPEDELFCENGRYKVSNHIIHDHHGYGKLTVNAIIKKSSNIGTVKISHKLGPEKMYHYLTRFNFGQKTGIDFPGESSGLLRDYRKWHILDTANVAFGQGVSVTALQMVMAMSALANDGVMMRPFIVSKVMDSQGRILKRNRSEILRRVISTDTAKKVQAMLRMVVEEGGTGVKADSKSYPAAGKTGTAQKLDKQTGTYSDHKYFSSFLGFVPYQNPELVIFVGLDEPSSQTYGGTVAAPVFKEIAEQVLPMLNVPPVSLAPENPMPATLTKAEIRTVSEPAAKRAPSNTLSVKIDPRALPSVTTRDEEKKHARMALAQKEEDLGNQAAAFQEKVVPGIMPDLSGLSMRRVMDLMAKHNAPVEFTGSGLAVWQSPQPGKPLSSGQVCQVRFEQW